MSSSNQFNVGKCPCPFQKHNSEGSLTPVNFNKKAENFSQADTQIILGFCFLRHQILEKGMKGDLHWPWLEESLEPFGFRKKKKQNREENGHFSTVL